jgi:hypothetical protein
VQVDEQVGRFEDEFDPESDDGFVAESVVGQVVEFVVRTDAVVLTFV